MKKVLLGLGALAATLAPATALISCSNSGKTNGESLDFPKPPFTKLYSPVNTDGSSMSDEDLIENNLTMVAARYDLGSVIYYVESDSSGYQSPTLRKGRLSLNGGYAKIGDLSILSSEEVANRVIEVNKELTNWLNLIDDWKYEVVDGSWEITSKTLDQIEGHWHFGGGIRGRDYSSKPSIKFKIYR